MLHSIAQRIGQTGHHVNNTQVWASRTIANLYTYSKPTRVFTTVDPSARVILTRPQFLAFTFAFSTVAALFLDYKFARQEGNLGRFEWDMDDRFDRIDKQLANMLGETRMRNELLAAELNKSKS